MRRPAVRRFLRFLLRTSLPLVAWTLFAPTGFT
jgi:hypothetical protein